MPQGIIIYELQLIMCERIDKVGYVVIDNETVNHIISESIKQA